jgi:hypothetical protein
MEVGAGAVAAVENAAVLVGEYTPLLRVVPAEKFSGTWTLLCAKPEGDAHPSLLKAGEMEYGVGMAKRKTPDEQEWRFVCYDVVTLKTDEKVVWGALMKERKGAPWLALGDASGHDVTLVLYTAGKVVKTGRKASWPTSAEFVSARARANAATEKLVLLRQEAPTPLSATTGGHKLDGEPLTKKRFIDLAPELGLVAVSTAEWEKKEEQLAELRDALAQAKRKPRRVPAEKKSKPVPSEGPKTSLESSPTSSSSASSSSSRSPSPRRKKRSQSRGRERSKSRRRSEERSGSRGSRRSNSRERKKRRSRSRSRNHDKDSRHHEKRKCRRSRSRRSRSRSGRHKHKSHTHKKRK